MIFSTSNFNNYSDGYVPAVHANYLLGLNLGIGVVEKEIGHAGSFVLDEINAFDRAEVDEALMGEINMITVSSFCGLNGYILGHDVFLNKKVRLDSIFNKNINVFSAWPLIETTKSLLGTLESPRDRFVPGAHVLCAAKNYKSQGPAIIYSAIAIAIPADRGNSACLMMEDSGQIPIEENKEIFEEKIQNSLVRSVLAVAENQRVKYNEVYVALKSKFINGSQIGCALVASPYIVPSIKIGRFLETQKNIKNTKKEDLDGIFQNQ